MQLALAQNIKAMKYKILKLSIIPIFLAIVGTAQQKNSPSGLNKYEIVMDLQNFFSDGYPDKVLFKVNDIKNNQIKGAYRFGLGAMYWLDTYKITQDDKNYETTAKEDWYQFSLSLGYEYQRKLNQAVFYYGADIGSLIAVRDDKYRPNVNEAYNFFLVPFTGVKVFLNANLSLAFEAGIMNYLVWSKHEGSDTSPDNRQYHSSFESSIKLPYSLTFNFNF